MAAIILELRHKHNEQASFAHFDQSPIHLGRDFSNDVILDDAFVSAQHAKLELDDQGNWLLSDLNSENGSILAGKTLAKPTMIQAGDYVELGDTQLRIVTPDMPVKATRIRHNVAWYIHALASPLLAWGLCLFFCLTVTYVAYLETTSDFEWKVGGVTFGSVLLFSLFWVGCWAFAGKSFKNKTSFHLQLSVFVLYSFIAMPIDIFTEYAEYIFSSALLGTVLSYISNLILGIAILYISLWIASNMQQIKRLVVAGLVVCSLALLTFSMQSLVEHNQTSTVLKPPFIRTMPASNVDDYFAMNMLLLDSLLIEDAVKTE